MGNEWEVWVWEKNDAMTEGYCWRVVYAGPNPLAAVKAFFDAGESGKYGLMRMEWRPQRAATNDEEAGPAERARKAMLATGQGELVMLDGAPIGIRMGDVILQTGTLVTKEAAHE